MSIISTIKEGQMEKRNLKSGVLGWVLLMTILFPFGSAGKPLLGVLPVNARSEVFSGLNEQQQQSLMMQLQDLLVTQLQVVAIPTKLSREHILLLMKEVPAPDPEKLSEEAYRIISKKENLTWILKCSVESLQVQKENARTVVQLIILEGNTGKVFWTKKFNTVKILSSPFFSEHLLLNELFKPMLDDAVNEIKMLSL
jgi:hypothetical protein